MDMLMILKLWRVLRVGVVIHVMRLILVIRQVTLPRVAMACVSQAVVVIVEVKAVEGCK
jgi:hypothetical protein